MESFLLSRSNEECIFLKRRSFPIDYISLVVSGIIHLQHLPKYRCNNQFTLRYLHIFLKIVWMKFFLLSFITSLRKSLTSNASISSLISSSSNVLFTFNTSIFFDALEFIFLCLIVSLKCIISFGSEKRTE